MKKYFTVLSVLLFIGIASINADEKSNGTSSRPLDIHTTKGFAGLMRSIDQEVKAFLNDTAKTIEIELFDFTDGEIYIVDHNNQVVDMTHVFAGDTYVILNQPETAGHYSLIITSNEYYGEGYFCIE
ncbi:MAG: hypothetical protein IJ421_06265 [Prevotella sp.]|nr:hypothetical protein [Prevotella sp.]